jgi:hypothetical protein
VKPVTPVFIVVHGPPSPAVETWVIAVATTTPVLSSDSFKVMGIVVVVIVPSVYWISTMGGTVSLVKVK